MTTSSITRPTEDICPPWCNGHLAGYGAWETCCTTEMDPSSLCAGTGEIREHSGVTVTVAGVSAYLNQTERGDHTVSPAVVNVSLLFDIDADLTPGEARAFAHALLMLANAAEARG